MYLAVTGSFSALMMISTPVKMLPEEVTEVTDNRRKHADVFFKSHIY